MSRDVEDFDTVAGESAPIYRLAPARYTEPLSCLRVAILQSGKTDISAAYPGMPRNLPGNPLRIRSRFRYPEVIVLSVAAELDRQVFGNAKVGG